MSDLLIRGMEMPKEEKISLTIFPDGRVYKRRGDLLRGYGEDCIPWKAVSVPPHGLIAREQILDAIRLELAQANACNDMDDYDAWMRVFDYVRKFPTIIPAEEG